MIDLDNLDKAISGAEEVDSMPDLEDGDYENPENSIEEPSSSTDEEEFDDSVEVYDNESEEDESEEDIEYEGEDSDVEIVETNNDVDSSMEFDIGNTKLKVNNTDELKTIAQNALKDKFKFDQYKDDISVIEGLKDQGVEQEDLYLLAAAKKGDQKALAKLLKKSGVDPYDLDIEDEDIDNYRPEEVKADMNYIEAKAILSDLKQNPEVDTKFNNLVMKEFDEQSRKSVFDNVNNLQFIAELTKSGMLEQILPSYTKKKLLGAGKDSFSMLVESYDEYVKSLENQKEEKVKEVQTKAKQKATKRRKAAVGSKQKRPAEKKDPINMSDEEFEEYYKNLTGGYGFAVD